MQQSFSETPRYVVLVAGGSGSRMNSEIPKQFLLLDGFPVLMRTIAQFYSYDPAQRIIVVLPANQLEQWAELCRQYYFSIPVQVATGGATRTESVQNGLALIEEENSLVAIHDGVRPFVNLQLIEQCYQAAYEKGAAVAAIDLKDSIRQLDGNTSFAVDRTAYKLVQTPQTFKTSLIKAAYLKAVAGTFTDDASVAEAAGYTITLTEGHYQNIKITTPEDLLVGEAFVRAGEYDVSRWLRK
jgi:2-C-methyl-D-erythritol 4-phosphate cytidylyltransferase